jgi:basic amino acid/polyamine antiporter, APA family
LSKPKTFLRDATGLVRELTALDVYIIAVSVICIGGSVQTSITFLGLYPGADLPWAFTLALIPGIAFVVVYAILTSAFPRSGGDYVWVSRIAGPFTGLTFSWILQFSYLFFVLGLQAQYVAWMGVPSVLTAMGLIMHASDLTSWSAMIASSKEVAVLISFVFLILGGLVALLGARVYSRIQKVLWIYAMFGIAVWLVLLATATRQGFVSSFNSVMSGVASYEGIIKTAADQGLLRPTNMGATMTASLTLGWTAWAGFNYAVYSSGEIRNPSKTMPISLIGGLLTCWALLLLAFSLAARVFGMDFMTAMSALAVVGTAPQMLPVGPSMSFLIATLTTNPFLLFVVTSSLIVWWFLILPPLYLAGSRVLFAWSYDRLIPAKISEVNETLHSPVLAIVLCVAVNAFWAYVATYTVYVAWMSLSFLQGVGWAVPGFVAAVFPYVKKDLYARTVGRLPPTFSRKIAGVPILTIAGLVQGISMVFYAYSTLSPTFTYIQLSPAVTMAFLQLIVLVIGAVVYLAAARAYRTRQGIDLRMIFNEIPPE